MALVAPRRHGALEDAQGIVFGTVLAAFGITVLTRLGLVTA